ncbi:Mini-ribonuclease 3 [Dethiothermospora halolimnae]|uniref:Mini-ribonuclease 3 n=1 Tax=Dethiothermospora halolimnae TaxID=3114390 RepID=UPI003CCB8FEA
MDKSFLKKITKVDKSYDKRDARMLSPLQLAYLGDSVYEVLVRTYLLTNNNVSVNKLHKKAIKYVKAKAQAGIVFSLEKNLTEEEWGIVKWGRNAKSLSVPKNANISDYKYATGFETLIGFLYLTEEFDRIFDIFDIIIEEK